MRARSSALAPSRHSVRGASRRQVSHAEGLACSWRGCPRVACSCEGVAGQRPRSVAEQCRGTTENTDLLALWHRGQLSAHE